MYNMISRKRALFYAIVTALAAIVVTALVTTSIVNARIAAGDTAVLDSNQLKLWQSYQKVDEVRKLIQDNYYNYLSNEPDCFQGAARGMVDELGDPYSYYMDADEFKEFNSHNSGTYSGVGMTLNADENGSVVIVRVYTGSPAEKAGVRAGDVIVTVDGEDVLGQELEVVASKVRGEQGTKVKVGVSRNGENMEFEMERQILDIPRVIYRMLDHEGAKLGYLLLTEFNGNCVEQFEAAMTDLREQGAQGVVLDLRDNPGGYLHSCVEIADMLLPDGLIVYTQDRNGARTEYKSDKAMLAMPMVVLVNGNSASASEILAGALQDQKRAPLVGEQTYGKALVQDIFPLEDTDSAAVRLTIASYFTPNGRMINGEGLAPDFVVELNEAALSDGVVEESEDTQLKEAIQVLIAQITGIEEMQETTAPETATPTPESTTPESAAPTPEASTQPTPTQE